MERKLSLLGLDYGSVTVKHLIVNTTFIEDDDAKAGVLLTMNEINDTL